MARRVVVSVMSLKDGMVSLIIRTIPENLTAGITVRWEEKSLSVEEFAIEQGLGRTGGTYGFKIPIFTAFEFIGFNAKPQWLIWLVDLAIQRFVAPFAERREYYQATSSLQAMAKFLREGHIFANEAEFQKSLALYPIDRFVRKLGGHNRSFWSRRAGHYGLK